MNGGWSHLTRNKQCFPFNPHPTFGHPLPLPQARGLALAPASGGEGELSAVTLPSFVLPTSTITRHNNRLGKAVLDPKFGLGGGAVGADAVFDGDLALLILAERRVNQAVVVAHVAVDDGEIFLPDGAAFPDFAEFAGGFGIFGDDDDAAGFAVEAVDEMRLGSWVWDLRSWILKGRSRAGGRRSIQINSGAADEAGEFIALGRMTNQSGRFVDDQQAGVFVDDGEQVFQAREILTTDGHGVKPRGGHAAIHG